ncbi:VOC family protein [Vibrio campbellii]|mgnify:CR=1 FL=1|uniref:VOC family protein n=1 Tax=Vibrio campbellii TaxID=680 RepID=UPI0002AE615F|nr:VOC family protein [Vibrio campbellii]MED5503294.1 VOC family protein [Pseudomonadota bacterium]ARV75223.1 lactoylglutathione lyase [Vibrio campbellii CAIM 519 = NBRC 15631 = ATCC 25920]ELU51192.1 methylmalonyl CoA epimerase [Vibrio campbellii CAIM 519 = NBRC 15631 = ATCC 25920]UTZ39064.1 VOC family protein [Vibrio campbellii]UTZ43747.1 VOC family protein [Vibrio campbellii]
MANQRNPIEIKALDHVVLRTDNLDAMLRFYRDLLGCPIERELPYLGLTQLRAGTAIIDLVTVESELGKLGGKSPSQDGRNLDHFCLQIAPFEESELLEYLHQHNVHVEEFAERYGAQGFGRSVYLEDPEGNVVELKPQK